MKQDLTPVDVARGHILAACNPLGVERVALSDVALDPAPRFLGAPLSSTRNLPAFDNSAMDGYAVGPLVGPMLGEAPFSLRLVGQSLAGHGTDIVVGAGEAIAITTGAPIPKGTFAVVMREQCDESRVKDGVVVKHTPGAGEHIRRAGEDVTRGRVVADVGARLVDDDGETGRTTAHHEVHAGEPGADDDDVDVDVVDRGGCGGGGVDHQSNTITERVTSPFAIAASASSTWSSVTRAEIIASRSSFPWR